MIIGYDIRGIYGKDITPDHFFRFGYFLRGKKWIVGGDTRKSTYPLLFSLLSGMLSSGKDVVFLGNYNIGYSVFSGILTKRNIAYVTASHLPREWNGLKLYDKKGLGYIDKNIFRESKIKDISEGSFFIMDFKEKYKKIVSHVEIDKRIMIDFGGGATIPIGKEIWKKVCKNCNFLFDRIDPEIKVRNPEPKGETLARLRKLMRKCNLGIAYDYDGDRVLFIERNGKIIQPEEMGLIYLLNTKGKKVILNVACFDIFSEFGIKVKFIPVGHNDLVKYSLKEKPDIAIEASGHMTIPRYFHWDDGLLASIILSSEFDEKLLKEIPRIKKKEWKFDASNIDYEKLLEEFRKEFGEGLEMDGYRKDFDNWFVLVRKGKTEPKIKIIIGYREGVDSNKIKEKINTILKEFGIK